jgi:hypothetical protein
MSVVDQLKKDLGSAHVRQQAARVLRLFVFAFVSQLAALGTDHIDRKVLLSVAVGALEAVYRQFAPVVPWASLADRLHLMNFVQSNVPAPGAAPATVTPIVPPAASNGTVPPAAP